MSSGHSCSKWKAFRAGKSRPDQGSRLGCSAPIDPAKNGVVSCHLKIKFTCKTHCFRPIGAGLYSKKKNMTSLGSPRGSNIFL